MNKEDIIRMAREAGVYSGANETVFAESLKRFATLVASAEREALETACDRIYHQHIGPQFGEVRYGIAACKDAIHARGNT